MLANVAVIILALIYGSVGLYGIFTRHKEDNDDD